MNAFPDKPTADQLRRARVRLEQSVRAGHVRAAESCFMVDPALRDHRDSALDLIYSEFVLREQLGQQPDPADWLVRFPDLRSDLEEMFRLHDEFAATEAPLPRLSAVQTVTTAHDAGPYELLEEIGRGGMGVVYRARDRRLGRIVAVKFLQGERAGQPEALERFRREARAASALNSPHICTIYEMDEQAGQPFIAMEWVEGHTLREQSQFDASIATITQLASQVAQALSVAHAAGIVHRDIKPGNIVIRAGGCAKVLDFGMARLLTSDGSAPALATDGTTPGTLIGTVAYMSPEQARCEPAGPPSDVFSLGVMLYELATSHHPFERDSPVATLAAVMADEPLPATSINPDVPAALGDLIACMLAKRPADRPSATDVQQSLAALGSAGVLGVADRRAPRDGPAIDTSSGSGRRNVGREREIDRLREALAAASNGEGLYRCVAGEPGIGKTTLVDRFLAGLSGPPTTCPSIGRGRCSERLAGSEAYLPVIEAIEGLLRGDPTGSAARNLRQVAPTWHAQITAADLSAPTDHAVATVTQERLKREFLAFLRETTRARPCVLFLDDVHWADLSTVDLLAYLGAHCAGLRLMVILTYRPSDLVLARHPLLPVLQELEARGVSQEIALPFLSHADIERYLDAEFRGHAFPAHFAAFLLGQTSGNPLFLVDLLRYLSETGVVARDAAGAWSLTKPPAEFQRELPQSVRSMVQRKIDQLLEPDRQLLTMASVQGHEFDAAVVARALGQDAAEVEDRLAALHRLHAVVKQVKEVELPDQTLTTRFAFVHVLYGNALFASLQPARKAAAAAAVAAAMRAAHAGHPEPVAVQMAVLLETARDFASAADYFLLAAENARRLFAQREAAALARRGLGLIVRLPEGPARVTLELRLTMALGIALQSAAGHGNAEVKQIFGRARELCAAVDDTQLRFQTLTGLFWSESARGNFLGACRDLSVELLAIAATRPEPEYALQAHHAHGPHLLQVGRPIEAETHFRSGLQKFDRDRHARLGLVFGQNPAVMCLGFSAMNVALMGRTDEGVARAEASITLAQEIADVPSLIFAYFFRLFVAAVRRDPGPALADGPAYVEHARDTPFFHATLRAYLGYAEAQSGQIDRGLHELHSAVAAFRAAGGLALIPTFCALLGDLLLSAGRHAEAALQIEDGLNVARECGNPWFDPELLRLRAVALMNQGATPDDVANAFAAALHCAREQQAAVFELRTLIDALRAGVDVPGHHLGNELVALHGRLAGVNRTSDMDAAAALIRRAQ